LAGFAILADWLATKLLLNLLWVARVALSLDLWEHLPLVFQEKWVLEHLVICSFPLRFMKVIHVQLTDKRREVVMLEILGQDLVAELIWLLNHKSITLRLNPANDGISLLVVDNFVKLNQK